MARKPKPSGRLNRGPWTGRELLSRLEAIGWYEVGQRGSHIQLKHPSRPGRVTVDRTWTHITTRTQEFASLSAQTGLGRKDLQRLMNR